MRRLSTFIVLGSFALLSSCDCGRPTASCPTACPEGQSCDEATGQCACASGTAACDAGCCGAIECDGGVACDGGCCAAPDVSVVSMGNDASSPSIAIDSQGRPHVAFLLNAYDLQYAVLDADGWKVTPIGIAGENAYSDSIALDSNDQPMVAFSANYAIKLARFDGTSWNHQLVFSSSAGYGPTLYQQAVALDATGAPHIAVGQEEYQTGNYADWIMDFTPASDGGWLRTDLATYNDNRISRPAISAGDGGIQVSWITYYDDVLNHASNQTGTWVKSAASTQASCCGDSFLAQAKDGSARIVFEDANGGEDLAQSSATGWNVAPLSAPDAGSLKKVGTVAVDSQDQLHYLFLNAADQLVYVSPGSSGESAEIVGDGAQEFMLALDRQDHAHIVYTASDGLHYLRR